MIWATVARAPLNLVDFRKSSYFCIFLLSNYHTDEDGIPKQFSCNYTGSDLCGLRFISTNSRGTWDTVPAEFFHDIRVDQIWRDSGKFLSVTVTWASWRLNLTACPTICSCDHVIKGKHFPRYSPFVRGIHRSPVNSPYKGQWRDALTFSLICAWTNDWVNHRDASDLRRNRAHYDVTLMIYHSNN